MNRITLMLALMSSLVVAVVAAPPAGPPQPAPKAAAPLALTKDELAMVLGYDGRARAIRLQAELDLNALAAERSEYLKGVAARLRIDPRDFGTRYVIDATKGTLEPMPIPQKAPEAKP